MADDNIEEALGCFEHHCSGMGDEDDAKQARIELDALLADRKRLEWLIKSKGVIYDYEQTAHECEVNYNVAVPLKGGGYKSIDYCKSTPREAIDAAMKENPDDN